MRQILTAMMIGWCGAAAAQSGGDAALSQLCASNPAFSESIMRDALDAQLTKDHDPALDTTPPEQLAQQAVGQAISDCAKDLAHDTATLQALSGLAGADRAVAWDAYNTTCSDHGATRGDCIRAELGSVRALKRMVATDDPKGSKALVETCELVLQTDPAMADWRQCVDQGLAVHADPDKTAQCKLQVAWHSAKTGAEAGRIVAACLGGK